MRIHHGRRQAARHRKRRRRAHHAVYRRLHRRRRSAGRPTGETSGGYQPEKHPLRHQASDWPPLRRKRSTERHQPRPLQNRQGRQRRRLGRSGGQKNGAAGSVRARFDENEKNGGRLPRRKNYRRRHHRACLLQRQPAPGDQRRRPHRRAERQAHHQRTDRSRPGLRHGSWRARRENRRL